MSITDIRKKVQACLATLPQQEEIERILLFGSHLHDEAREDSDVDLLIELRKPVEIGLFEFTRIQRALEQALEKQVDLGTPDSLSKYIREEVLQEAEVIYEK